MECQNSKFQPLKSKNRRARPGLINTMTCLIMFCTSAILVNSESALAGPGKDKGKGGSGTTDLPANTMFLEIPGDAVNSDGLDYINGQERVSCFIGRREGQFSLTTSNKPTSGRMLYLDDQGQIDHDNPGACGDFSGHRVSEMRTAQIQGGGEDLRYLQGEVVMPLWLNVRDDRQNFWHVQYNGVRVEPVAFGGDGNPTSWAIDTDCTDCAITNVSRIVDNQYVDAIDCGQFELPFHLKVDLQ